MRTILWYQGSSTDSVDVYLLNGESVVDENQKQAIIKELSSYRKIKIHDIGIKKTKEKNILSENAKITRTDKGIFISSNFETTDVVGRKIVYEFYCESKDISTALEQLITISQKQDRKCNAAELIEIQKVFVKPKISTILKKIFLLALISLAFTFFLIQC